MKRTLVLFAGITFAAFFFTSCCGRGCLLGKKNIPALQETTTPAG
jgi:hypothetical protein